MGITPAEALHRALTQSADGPPFRAGTCKKQVRRLYDVPSDGSPTAAIAWTRTKYRHQFHDTPPPIGALIWWAGGTNGYGHVAIYEGNGLIWSTDIEREGFFDRVTIHRIAQAWPSCRLVGWSEDIDGVRVINYPTLEELEVITDEDIMRIADAVLRRFGVDDPAIEGTSDRGVAGALTAIMRRLDRIEAKIGADK